MPVLLKSSVQDRLPSDRLPGGYGGVTLECTCGSADRERRKEKKKESTEWDWRHKEGRTAEGPRGSEESRGSEVETGIMRSQQGWDRVNRCHLLLCEALEPYVQRKDMVGILKPAFGGFLLTLEKRETPTLISTCSVQWFKGKVHSQFKFSAICYSPPCWWGLW